MFRFEAASSEDFSRLFELRLATMRESLERIGRFDRQRAFERFRNSFRPEHTRLIILEDDTFAGCVALGPSDDGLLLEHFYLAPDYQSKGLGGSVLRRLLAEADASAKPISLSVLQQSDAGRFYERHGFVEVGRDDWDIYLERQPFHTSR